jgi:hypothetical protein
MAFSFLVRTTASVPSRHFTGLCRPSIQPHTSAFVKHRSVITSNLKRAHYYTAARPGKQVKTASVGGLLGVVLSVALLAAYIDYSGHLGYIAKHLEPFDSKMASLETAAAEVPATTGQLQPGRPGNLTPEQEAKLRELWILFGKLFGTVTQEELAQGKDSLLVKSVTPLEKTPTPSTTEPTKRRFGLFRRKKEEDVPTSDATTPASGWSSNTAADIASSGGAANDKHGQGALFNQAMANSTPEELRDAFWEMTKHDHPDGLFLRFLRARKWDVNAALMMAISALHWRLTDPKVDEEIMHIGEMGMIDYANGTDSDKKTLGNDFMEQIRIGKSFIHGFDKSGRPICYIRVRLHHQGDQSEASLERFTVYTIETARLMLAPPVDTAVCDQLHIINL